MTCRVVFLSVLVVGVVLLAWLSDSPQVAADVTSSQYTLRSSVVGAAGRPGSSAHFSGKGTLGQSTPIGVGASSGKTLYAGFWSAPWAVASVTGESPAGGLVDCLYNSAPNPFSTSTVIAYSLRAGGSVEVTVFNTSGQRVRRLVADVESPGRHVVSWDGRDDLGSRVSAGVYFYSLRTSSVSLVKKLIVVK